MMLYGPDSIFIQYLVYGKINNENVKLLELSKISFNGLAAKECREKTKMAFDLIPKDK